MRHGGLLESYICRSGRGNGTLRQSDKGIESASKILKWLGHRYVEMANGQSGPVWDNRIQLSSARSALELWRGGSIQAASDKNLIAEELRSYHAG
jgi:hypothetical protein